MSRQRIEVNRKAWPEVTYDQTPVGLVRGKFTFRPKAMRPPEPVPYSGELRARLLSKVGAGAADGERAAAGTLKRLTVTTCSGARLVFATHAPSSATPSP